MSCEKSFTTKFRLKSKHLEFYKPFYLIFNILLAHINRFHTPPECQVMYKCISCPYRTAYKSDLKRHKRQSARCNRTAHLTPVPIPNPGLLPCERP